MDDLILFNHLGMPVEFTIRMEEQRFEIDAAGLIPGLYYLRLNDGSAMKFNKLMRM